MYVCDCVCDCMCMCVGLCVCVWGCVYVCGVVCISECMCMWLCVVVCIYVCMCVVVYVLKWGGGRDRFLSYCKFGPPLWDPVCLGCRGKVWAQCPVAGGGQLP